MWKAYKKVHFDPTAARKAKLEQEIKEKLGGKRTSEKFRDAEEFIRRIMRMYGDTMPTKEGTNKDGKTVWIVPYETQDSLFQEYMWEAKILRKLPKKIAKKTCFKKVFKSLEDEIRLLGCKGPTSYDSVYLSCCFYILTIMLFIGSLPTCSVCNTAHEMLRNTVKWNESQRDVILQYLRLHLKQQQTERLQLDAVKIRCKEKSKRTVQSILLLTFTYMINYYFLLLML